jgi:hypothetical protein
MQFNSIKSNSPTYFDCVYEVGLDAGEACLVAF